MRAETITYRTGLFVLDSITQQPVPGYTADEQWNGWACPCFDQAAADNLVWQPNESYVHYGETRRAYYDSERDMYVTPYDGGDEDDWDTWGAQIVTINGVDTAVYPIGVFSWCWIEHNI